MRVRGKPVPELSAEDLQALIEAQTPESRHLEYKAELPSGKDDDKREFLADVTAFANTNGGTILYGVTTGRDASGKDTGIPTELTGVGALNLDAELLRLQSMLRDGVDPALTRIAFQRIDVEGARGPVIALGVAQSLVLPHMIAFNRSGKVFRRSESDKYQVDVSELRRMILEGSDWGEEAETFRSQRIRVVRQRELVPDLSTGAILLLHLLPFGRLNDLHDLRPFEATLPERLRPPRGAGWDTRWNIDGFLVHSTLGAYRDDSSSRTLSYVQWFRCGGVEVCLAGFDSEWNTANRAVNGTSMSRTIESAVQRACGIMNAELGVDPPYAVMVSLVDVHNIYLAREGTALVRGPFQRNIMPLPAIVLDALDDNLEAALRPVLDIMWQAAGWAGSPPSTS